MREDSDRYLDIVCRLVQCFGRAKSRGEADMPLSEEEQDAAYSSLAEAARACSLGWVLEQVEGTIAVGKTTIHFPRCPTLEAHLGVRVAGHYYTTALGLPFTTRLSGCLQELQGTYPYMTTSGIPVERTAA